MTDAATMPRLRNLRPLLSGADRLTAYRGMALPPRRLAALEPGTGLG